MLAIQKVSDKWRKHQRADHQFVDDLGQGRADCLELVSPMLDSQNCVKHFDRPEISAQSASIMVGSG